MVPEVSVVIPTHNRPGLIVNAVKSVLNQTYQDLEVIVVDDGSEAPAKRSLKGISDDRLHVLNHETPRGGSAARNTGIKAAQGRWVAFLDDDDTWVPEKLALQMNALKQVPGDVGFCFTAVANIYGNREDIAHVPSGVADYSRLALRRFKAFLTVTLLIKKEVLNRVGGFDESFPSHQDAELMVRVTQECRGLGIDEPTVRVTMSDSHEQLGKKMDKKIAGKKMLLEKHHDLLQQFPEILARHYFFLAVLCRDYYGKKAGRQYFWRAWQAHRHWRYLAHYISSIF